MGRIRHVYDELRTMRPSRLVTILAASAIVAAGGTATAVAAATRHDAAATATTPTSGAVAIGPLHRLSWDVLPGLTKLSARGHPAADRTLHLGIMLANPKDAALARLASAVNDPASAQYRHFRTPSELDREFGLPASTGRELRRWLTGGGLTIGYAAPSNDFVQATGTVHQVDQLLDAGLATYRSHGTSFIANSRAPRVPANLGVSSLMGLNSLQRFAPEKPVVAKHTSPAATGCLEGITALCEEGYDARDMWRLYGAPKHNLGQGQTMAIFGEGQTKPVIGDLRRFEKYNRLPRVPVRVVHAGNGPFVSNDGQDEWDLDTQSSTGMAPDVKQLSLYFASSLTDADVTTLFAKWINDKSGPLQASASFAECETDPLNPVVGNPAAQPILPAGQGLGDNLEPAIETSLMPKILAEGRTLFNSSGDTGSSCPVVVLPGVGAGNGVLNQAVPLQNYPTVSKYVVAVGGTLLYSNGATPPKRKTEIASPYTGGGSSLFNSEPSWQKAVKDILVPCLVNYNGKPYKVGTTCRGVPDVSALFGDSVALGFDIFVEGRLLTTGGTSLSSPLWMGMWTRVQAASRHPKKGNGSAAPILYRVGTGPHYKQDFNDITVGVNGAYAALPGWDYVSGWGSPKLAHLTKTIDGRTKPTHLAAPKPAPLQSYARCSTVFRSPAHNAIDENLAGFPGKIDVQNQLDIVKGALSVTRNHKYLRTVMTISDLAKKLPIDASQPTTALPGGVDWVFDVVIKGVTYYADAHYETGAAVTYTGGKVSLKTGAAVLKPKEKVLGAFHAGKNGTIVMKIPLSALGHPKRGSRIQEPMAFTGLNSALPFLAFPDAAGPSHDYKLGHRCH
jgi:pseudomonalisin